LTQRSHFSIRHAVPSDAAAVTACVESAYEKWIAVIGKKPSPMLQNYNEVLKREQVFVSQVADEVAGVLVLSITNEGFLLDTVAVKPHSAGRGLGGKLLELAESEAIGQGFSAIYLYTHERMVENLLWYRRRGYVEYARRNEQGYSRVYMRKMFNAA
jgi:ribosomal protein S18 acetylase RimI-like enzyme